MMSELGARKKVITPSYADFIQSISIIFDLNKYDKNDTRPKEMIESRSMSRRQVIHADALKHVFAICKIEANDQKFLKTCFLKIENMLSDLKTMPIFTENSRAYGEICFSKLVSVPQIIFLLRFCRDVQGIVFAGELLHYLEKVVQQDHSWAACIKLLKEEITALISDVECAEFKLSMGKIDHRSFPKTQSIESLLDKLTTEIQFHLDKEKTSEIVQKVRHKLYAAKVVFKTFTFFKKSTFQLMFFDIDMLRESHKRLSWDYVCNKNVDENNFMYKLSADFEAILNLYKKSINYLNAKCLPSNAMQSIASLIRYNNCALLPLVVFKKFQWDLKRNLVNEPYIRSFEKAFLLTAKNYQYGQMAAYIASVLLALKIQKIAILPHQSLEPLTMVMMENCGIENEISLACDTPFGEETLCLPYTSSFNIIKAIGHFNLDVITGAIKEELCNPLAALDGILQRIFEKIDQGDFFVPEYTLPKDLMRIKPVKSLSIDLYDALKNINRLLMQLELTDTIHDVSFIVRVKSSKAGDAINRYLELENSDKINLLKKIDPEQCAKDLSIVQ